MQRHGSLHEAEVGLDMTAMFAYPIEHCGARFVCHYFQHFDIQLFKFAGNYIFST